MGTVHKLPVAADVHVRLLEKMVNEMISRHPDPQVASRWANMASETLSRYPGPPMPTQPLLDLDMVEGLTEAQAAAVQEATTAWLQSYFEDVRRQLMKVHRDLLTLQKKVAELESADR